MDRSKKIWLIVVAVALFGTGYYMGKNSSLQKEDTRQKTSEQALKIGFMGPLTGDAASYGESIKKGIELAKKESNIKNLEIIYEDTKCEGKDAVNAVNKLISVDKVIAIIGDVCSGATLAAAPVAQEKKVVLVSAASTSPKITDAGDYVFRVVPSDALQGDFGAQLVYNKGYKKLAILYSNEEYGVGFQEVLKKSFEKLGGKVVKQEAFNRNVTDVRTQLVKIRGQKPAALFIISNSPASSVAALKQIKAFGMKIALFGSEGLKSSDILSGAKDAADGLILTSVSSGTTEFTEKHKKEYNADPGPFSAQGYDAFMVLAKAFEKEAKTSDDIKEALKGTDLAGASGKIIFDSNGDVTGNYDVYIVKNGSFELSK
ncbi:penicillin-binding protein activator [Candidatus Uhrbacteria bacterium]|nr:penicillin-binding protein activator [Candidatus Uhrbacteria bacterium]